MLTKQCFPVWLPGLVRGLLFSALAVAIVPGAHGQSSATTPAADAAPGPVDTTRIQELFDSSVKAYGQGDFQSAEEGLQEVVKYAPNDAQPWFHLANVFALTDRPRRAVAAYSRALALDPTLGNAWHNMGMMHVLQAANSFRALSENVSPDNPLHSRANELTGILMKMLGRESGSAGPADTSAARDAPGEPDAGDAADGPEITQTDLESPAAAGTTGDVTEETAIITLVKNKVSTWARAWSNRDPDAYLSHYAADFSPSNTAYDTWVQQRRKRLRAPSFIQVDINELEVAVGNDKAVATFKQSYQSDKVADVTRKTLVFEPRDGDWRITREFASSE